MKSLFFLFVTGLCLTAFAYESSEVKVEEVEAADWSYSCTATDAHQGHFWGASNYSVEDAQNKAMTDCYRHSQDSGTCQLSFCR